MWRHAMTVLAPALVAAIAPRLVPAQTIRGQVLDQATSEPVNSVAVILMDSAGTVLVQQTTPADGRYALAAPAPGTYRLRFLAPGYRVLVTPLFDLVAGQELTYPLRLRPVPPTVLDTLVVEGRPVPWNLVGFYRRKQRGVGYFITRDEWERLGFFDVSRAVRWANPFVLPPNAAWGGGAFGRCTPSIFLDGIPLAEDTRDVSVALNRLSLYQLAAIEVYRAPLVPTEFDYPFGTCAAIALWSRVDRMGQGRPLALGLHGGAAVAGAPAGTTRLGAHAIIGFEGLIELYPAFNILGALGGSSTSRRGWELLFAVRVRPLGRKTGWYLGLGTRVGTPRATDAKPATGEWDLVWLNGWELRLGGARPFVELQVLGPLSPGSALLTGLVGVSTRVH